MEKIPVKSKVSNRNYPTPDRASFLLTGKSVQFIGTATVYNRKACERFESKLSTDGLLALEQFAKLKKIQERQLKRKSEFKNGD